MTNGIGRVGWRNFVSATPTTASIITTGLVLNLDAGNPLSYSGSGTTWTDLSGNGNNGTLTNGTSYSSANGGTLTFDGINDYVDTNLITNQSAFTYCIWGKSSTLGYPNRIMGNADALTGTNGANIIWGTPVMTGQAEDYNRFWFIRRNANNMTNDIMSPIIAGFSGNWHYIVATYDNVNGSKLYCDNVLVGSKANIGFASSLKLRIGKDGNGTDAFNGSVGAVQVYNKALNATEIATNFNATKSRFGFVSYTTRTAAFATATGITDATILNALNTFDTGLISNGLDTKMKALYPFVGGTANTHKYNFMNAQDTDAAFRLQFNGGWVHSSTGVKGNGTNTFANSFLTPINVISNINSTSVSMYLREDNTNSGLSIYSANTITGNGGIDIWRYNSNTYYSVNSNEIAGPANTTKGHYIATRIVSNQMKLIKGGSVISTSNTSVTNLPNNPVVLGGYGTGTSAVYIDNTTYSFTHIGDGLTDAEASTFYTLVHAFQTSLSRAV